MKRKALMFTVPALACCVLAACGTKEKAAPEEASTLTYWVKMDSNVATRIQSYNDVAMYKQREKDTGVHIEFIHPAAGQESEQFNLLLASKQFPDMIEYTWANYTGGSQAAIDNGVIIALNDYMEYAPNFNKALTDKNELSGNYRRGSMTDEGKYYGFTTLNVGDYRIFGGPCIRRDWLEELGLEIPQTIDDWTNALRAFKEKKNASAPLTGLISNLCTGESSTFSGAFGVGNRLYQEDGKVKYGPLEDGYKEFLTVLNQWYTEGLLDSDLASNKSALVDSKITGEDSGALVCGFIGGSLGRYLLQKEKEDPSYDLVGAPFPVKNKGEINRFPNMEQDVMVSNTLAITTACKNPETAVEWCDYWYSDEGYNLLNFGVEGESYNMQDGKPVYTDVVLKNPDGLSINESLQLYCRATAPAPGFKQAPEYLEQYYQYDQQKETLEKWVENTPYRRETQLQNLNSTPEEMDTVSAIKTELSTYVNETVWNFVTGKESLDNYNKFVEELKRSFRIEEYLKIMQDQLDRYNKRK